MLQILLDLNRFSAFLVFSAICMLLVCLHSKYVLVSYCKSRSNNRHKPVSMKNGLIVPCVSSVYGVFEPHHLFRNPIQNP